MKTIKRLLFLLSFIFYAIGGIFVGINWIFTGKDRIEEYTNWFFDKIENLLL